MAALRGADSSRFKDNLFLALAFLLCNSLKFHLRAASGVYAYRYSSTLGICIEYSVKRAIRYISICQFLKVKSHLDDLNTRELYV